MADAQNPNNNDMQLGGSAAASVALKNRMLQGAYGASTTAAPTTNYQGGDGYAAMAGDARNGATDALTLMQQRANGIHTANDATMNAGNANAVAQQHSMSLGAKGAGAIANAPQQFAGTASYMNTNNANNVARTDASDTAAAQDALAQGYGQMRSQDASQQGVYDARSQFGTDLGLRQEGLNDAGQAGFEKLGFGATADALAGEEALNNAQDADWAQRSGQNEQMTGINTQAGIAYGGAAANAAAAGAGYAASNGGQQGNFDPTYTGSDARIKQDLKAEGIPQTYAQKVMRAMALGGANLADFGKNTASLTQQGAREGGRNIADFVRKTLELNKRGAQQITHGAPPASSEMLDQVRPVSYTYKPGFDNAGQAPGEKHFGVLAQDLEKSPMGASLLAPPDASGVKKVDTRKVAMANLAATADVHQRLKALEESPAVKQYAKDQLEAERVTGPLKFAPEVIVSPQEREQAQAMRTLADIKQTPPAWQAGVSPGPAPANVALPADLQTANAQGMPRKQAVAHFNARMQPTPHTPTSYAAEVNRLRGAAQHDVRKALQINRDENQDVRKLETLGQPGVAASVPGARSPLLGSPATDMRSSMEAQFAAPTAVTPRGEDAGYNYGHSSNTDINRLNPYGREERPADAALSRKGSEMRSAMDAQLSTPSAVTRRDDHLRQQGDDMRSAMNAQFAAPSTVTSDETAKEDVESVGIPTKYAARVLELMNREASRGPVGVASPSARGQLLGAPTEMSREPNMSQDVSSKETPVPIGPPAPENLRLNSMGEPVKPWGGPPNVQEFVRKTLELNKKGAGQAADWARNGGRGQDLYPSGLARRAYQEFDRPRLAPDAKETNDAVPLSTLAGVDTTTKGEAPAPKTSDATAEPEMGPPQPAAASTYTNVPAQYHDLIGGKGWAALSERDKAAVSAALGIAGRDKTEADSDVAAADARLGDSNRQEVNAAVQQSIAEGEGQQTDAQRENLIEDAKHLATYHEDPNRFWNSRTTAQKMAGFIGVILGGFAQGLRGGQNAALEQINRAQDLDIESQRNDFRANKDSIEAKRSAYGMAMEKYNHDDTKATAAVKLAGLNKIEAQFQKTAAQHRGTAVDDRLAMALQDIQDRKAKEEISYHKYEESKQVANNGGADLNKEFGKYYSAVTEKGEQPMTFGEWAHGRMGGVVQGATWGASGDRREAIQEKKSSGDQERTIIVDGKPRLAVNKEVVKDWNDYSHVSAEAKRLYSVLQATKAGGVDDSLENQAKYNKAAAELREIMPQMFGFARGPSVAQVKHTLGSDFIPDYTHLWSPNTRTRANVVIDDFGKTLDTLDKSTQEHTLAQTGNPTIAPTNTAPGGNSTPKTFKEAR